MRNCSDSATLKLEWTLPGQVARDLYDRFTVVELLTQWWPKEATIDLRVGGAYELRWPAQGWTLRGTYSAIQPGEHLAFSWAWDHEPNLPPRQVDLSFADSQEGARLRVAHGSFGDSEAEQRDRSDILEGWIYAVERLAEAGPPKRIRL